MDPGGLGMGPGRGRLSMLVWTCVFGLVSLDGWLIEVRFRVVVAVDRVRCHGYTSSFYIELFKCQEWLFVQGVPVL